MSEVFTAITAGRSPRLGRRWAFWIIGILVMLSLGSCSFFSVSQGHMGVIAQTRTDSGVRVVDAGLHAKWPWQSLERIDGRLRLADLPPAEKRTGDGETVVVYPYAAWHVEPGHAALFLGAGGESAITAQLSELIWREMDIALAGSRLSDLLGSRAAECSDNEPLARLTDRVSAKCQPPALVRWGVRLLDVRIGRLVCPERAEPQILHRMIAYRRRQIDRQRSATASQAADIVQAARAEADNTLAEAKAKVRQIAQDTEAQVASILRRAGFDPDFHELVVTMERYHRLLDENASVVISDGKLFDALFQPGATNASPPSHDVPATRPVRSTTRPVGR